MVSENKYTYPRINFFSRQSLKLLAITGKNVLVSLWQVERLKYITTVL